MTADPSHVAARLRQLNAAAFVIATHYPRLPPMPPENLYDSAVAWAADDEARGVRVIGKDC